MGILVKFIREISSVKDLTNYIIPHFDTYPLCSSSARFVSEPRSGFAHETQKKADYELFKPPNSSPDTDSKWDGAELEIVILI